MWHYALCCHYFMCCHVFLPYNCLHYTWWSLDIHISLIWSPIPEFFSPLILAHHFLHIYYLIFYLEKLLCLQTLRSFYGVTSFSSYPLVEIKFFEKRIDLFLLTRFWILTIQTSHFYILAYCRLAHLISIEFQIIDNHPSTPPKNSFFSFNCYNLAICVVILIEILSTN
jgi:hypothetical protein